VGLNHTHDSIATWPVPVPGTVPAGTVCTVLVLVPCIQDSVGTGRLPVHVPVMVHEAHLNFGPMKHMLKLSHELSTFNKLLKVEL
jgi:hypothetical protein